MYVHIQTRSPCNSMAIKCMCKQCILGALSPPPLLLLYMWERGYIGVGTGRGVPGAVLLPPKFPLLTTLCVVSDCAPQSKSLSYAYEQHTYSKVMSTPTITALFITPCREACYQAWVGQDRTRMTRASKSLQRNIRKGLRKKFTWMTQKRNYSSCINNFNAGLGSTNLEYLQ